MGYIRWLALLIFLANAPLRADVFDSAPIAFVGNAVIVTVDSTTGAISRSSKWEVLFEPSLVKAQSAWSAMVTSTITNRSVVGLELQVHEFPPALFLVSMASAIAPSLVGTKEVCLNLAGDDRFQLFITVAEPKTQMFAEPNLAVALVSPPSRIPIVAASEEDAKVRINTLAKLQTGADETTIHVLRELPGEATKRVFELFCDSLGTRL